MKSVITSWIFCVVFAVIGVLNMVLVHPVPGIFYLVLSVAYAPPVEALTRKEFGFLVPLPVKIVAGLIVLWATLAVGDLAEVLGL